jgi:hypothetical protein
MRKEKTANTVISTKEPTTNNANAMTTRAQALSLPIYSGNRESFKGGKNAPFWREALAQGSMDMNMFPRQSIVLLEKNSPIEGHSCDTVCIVDPDPQDENLEYHVFSAKHEGRTGYASDFRHRRVNKEKGSFGIANTDSKKPILTEAEVGTIDAALRKYAINSVHLRKIWFYVHSRQHPAKSRRIPFKGFPEPIRLDARMIFDGIDPALSEVKTLHRRLVTVFDDEIVVISAHVCTDGLMFDLESSGRFPGKLDDVDTLPKGLLDPSLRYTIIGINRILQPDLI